MLRSASWGFVTFYILHINSCVHLSNITFKNIVKDGIKGGRTRMKRTGGDGGRKKSGEREKGDR